jgi:hypothetical protein
VNDQFRVCFRWTGSDADERRDRGVSLRQNDMSRKLKPVSPGEMLVEEILKPLGLMLQLQAAYDTDVVKAAFVKDAAEDQSVEEIDGAHGRCALIRCST